MEGSVLLFSVFVGALVPLVGYGLAWVVRRRAELRIVKMSLADAPEPYWSEIRNALVQTRLVSAGALAEGVAGLVAA